MSTNGDAILLSIKTKILNEIAETTKAIPICGRVAMRNLSELLKVTDQLTNQTLF